MPDPPGRSARRTHVVELNAGQVQTSRLRVAIAVHFHVLGNQPPRQENTLAGEALLQVEVVVHESYAH